MSEINFTVIGRTKALALEAVADRLAEDTNAHLMPMVEAIHAAAEANIALLTDNPTMSVQVTVQAVRGVIDGEPPVFTASFLTIQAYYTSHATS